MNIKQILESEKKAKKFAEKKHKDQTRRSGEPYINHPKRVAKLIKKYKSSHQIEALIKAALLHDTIEDTNTTEKDLKKLFGGLVASLVKQLTSDKEKAKENKTKYLTNKMINMSSWALVIKLADRLDNVQDITTAPKTWAFKYKKQTETILNSLIKNRILSNTQKKLINAIKNKLRELK